MQFTIIATLLAAAVSAVALPAAEQDAQLLYEHPTANESEAAGSSLAKRGTAQATSFSGNNCAGSSAFFQVGSGSTQCWVIRGGSIQVSGSGCRTRTFSGNNCRGSEFLITNSGCNPVQFASVLFEC